MNFSGIGTYSGRGTLKSGINPAEHAIVYLSGTDSESCYLPGEREAGMTRDPIEVVPVDSSVRIRPESRIRFGKTYPIEKNVKVKDIGIVHPSHRYKLVAYWQDRDDYGGSSSYLRSTPNYAISEPTQIPDPDSDSEDVLLLRRDAEHHLSAVALDSRLAGDLSSGLYHLSLVEYHRLTTRRLPGRSESTRFLQERHRLHGALAGAWR